MVIDLCAKYGYPMSMKKIYGPDTEHVENPYKFDLEVKFQGRILIMNVRDTYSYGDTLMCQFGKPMSNQNKLCIGHKNM